MLNLRKVPVQESFVTIQGEAVNTGRPTTFIRLVGCNLACSYCDTGYRPEDDRRAIHADFYSQRELLMRLRHLDAPYLCFTGGEPMLHEQFLYFLIEEHCKEKAREDEGWLSSPSPRYTIETNGTIPLVWDNSWRRAHSVGFTMDIKPFVYDHYENIYKNNLDYLKWDMDEVKIVITNQEDLIFAKHIIEDFPHLPYILSPVQNLLTGEFECKEELVDMVKKLGRSYNVRVGVQTHKILGVK